MNKEIPHNLNIGNMIDLSLLHTNQRLLVKELLSRGATVKILDLYDELCEVNYQGKIDFIHDRFSSVVPFHSVKMSADKHFAKKRLKKYDVMTPEGEIFTGNSYSEAIKYAKKIYPVVLKPNWGSHGDHVQVNIKNENDLILAIQEFIKKTDFNQAFIIEKFFPWLEYRLFITSQGGFAVVHRQPASIVGDGQFTIEYLIKEENIARLDLKKTTPTSICPIVIDEEVHRYLAEQELHLHSIPKLGQTVFLRQESNLAKGGKAIDVTDIIHPSYKELALKSLQAFPGLPMAGLDLLCPDITQPMQNDNYVILEINSSPGLAMHTYPTEGISRNVALLVMNVMFPYIPN